jgi:AraC-like DNA-binding protein
MHAESFDDFDEFAESVRGVDCTMMLQNAARRSWTLTAADVAGVRVQYGTLGSGNILEGQSWADGSLIYLPLSETCAYSACGTTIPRNAFMILEPGCEFALATKHEHDWCSIFIPDLLLNPFGDVDGLPAGLPKTRCRVTRPHHRLAGRLRTSVRSVLAAARGYPEFESSTAAVVASADLLQLGATILEVPEPPEHTRGGRPKIPRNEIIRRAKQLLEEHQHKHVSVADLVAATGVCERTLRDAFNESFGVGPTRYLQLRTLHQVKRALDVADPDDVSVARLVTDHGEWQLGRFAARYRRLFGELPSETLRRTHAV